MTRRLRIAGTAFGALLVPACTGMPRPEPTPPALPAAPGSGVSYRPMPGAFAAVPVPRGRPVMKFADERSEPGPAFAQRPAAATAVPPVERTDFRTTETGPAQTVPPAPIDPPRLVVPGPSAAPTPTKPEPEPVTDAEGVRRPPWPVIKGAPPISMAPAEPRADAVPPSVIPPSPGPVLPPIIVPPKSQAEDPPAAIAPAPSPAALPPGVIGTSVHQTNSSPASGTTIAERAFAADPMSISMPAMPMSAPAPQPAAAESPLILAVRALQQNKPDEAVEHLKAYDPATQQVLLSLMPAMVRLSESKLQQMKPEELDALLDQLNRVPMALRPRASLQATGVRLCREVHNFAHVEPFPDRHEFRPGDVVYLYMELHNFSCVPEPKGGYTVTLASSLELRDAGGVLVWRADPKEVPDHVSSPPQDYYRNFRLCVPNVPPGAYSLWVKTIDRPTGREARKAVELRVGAR
ncbi:MAG TPA: hypothetical protein VKE40_02285 [Gemmataceae bacterium]|nr:hypothetical protein [Gemmataceae bacterium]